MTTCTLLLIVKDGEILLAMKKRGFGAGRWNGAGGKVEKGETVEKSLIRECQEEIGVTPVSFEKVAMLEFVFPDNTVDVRAHTFLCNEWEGEPIETEEMAPRWFKISDIPYDEMWQDDKFWLPEVLAGKKLHARFTFDPKQQLIDSKIHEASFLE